MKFLVIEDQDGCGCDYTIGCGKKYYFQEADSIDEVVKKIIYPDGMEENDGYSYALDDASEFKLKKIYVVPAEHVVEINMEKIKSEYRNAMAQRKDNEEKQKELELLEKLEKKYRK